MILLTERHRAQHTQGDAGGNHPRALPDDHDDDVEGSGTDRHANANLMNRAATDSAITP